MATKLQEATERLEAKRKELADIFAQAGDDLDFSKVTSLEGDTAAKVAAVKARNAELADLAKEREALVELSDIKSGVDELGGRLNNPGRIAFPGAGSGKGMQREEFKSIGQMFVESPAFKNYDRTARKSPAVEFEVGMDFFQAKALVDETAYAPQAIRTGLILPGLLRRPVVADLIPQTTTSQIAVVYMEETTTTNGAAAVAEGGTKPESALAFTERTSPVRKIATVLPVTDELMQDEPMMRGYVEQRLRLFLALEEETQLVGGSGVAPNLTGILNTANILTQAKGADPTPDAIYKGMVKILTTSFLSASGMVIHPNDWQDIRLLRTADGLYIFGNPQDPGPDRIWGLSVVQTTAMTEGTGLVAAFDTAMQIARRTEVSFAVSDQHSDFFITNKLMLRVEERLALVVYRPQAVCTITGI